MAVKSCTSSPELFDSFLASPPRNEVLEMINHKLDWKKIASLVTPLYSSAGRPGFSPVLLIKLLLLESLYQLSDVRVVEEASDRLSFRHFLQIKSGEAVPDDTTLVKFRNRLRQANLLERIFTEIHQQMASHGVAVQSGNISVVDATLIPAAVNKPPRGDEENPALRCADPDADVTVKNGDPLYGYKLHLAQDRKTGLISSFVVTPASVADITMLPCLITGREKEVLADKGYTSRDNKAYLEELGIKCSILYRGARNHPLSPWKKARNRSLSRVRSFVEGAFANLKRYRRCGRAVYIGLEKVTEQITLGILVHNLMRFSALARG